MAQQNSTRQRAQHSQHKSDDTTKQLAQVRWHNKTEQVRWYNNAVSTSQMAQQHSQHNSDGTTTQSAVPSARRSYRAPEHAEAVTVERLIQNTNRNRRSLN
jgi:hypothetical protein